MADLLVGLGHDSATEIEALWPDRERTRSRFKLASLRNGTLIVSKTRGVVSWNDVPWSGVTR